MLYGLIKLIIQLFNSPIASGVLYVSSSGKIEIKTGFTPVRILIDLGHQRGVHVCSGDSDGFDTVIIPHGFLVVSKLHSHSRKIKWIAIGQ